MRTLPILAFLLSFSLFLVGCPSSKKAPWGKDPQKSHRELDIKDVEPSDSAEYLEKLLHDSLSLYKADLKEEALSRLSVLEMKDPKTWFSERFGPQLGAQLAATYPAQWKAFQELLPKEIKSVMGVLDPGVQIFRFKVSGSRDASAAQNFALNAMDSLVPISSAALVNGTRDKIRLLESFAFVDGDFRYIGTLEGLLTQPLAPPGLPVLALASLGPQVSISPAFSILKQSTLLVLPSPSPSACQFGFSGALNSHSVAVVQENTEGTPQKSTVRWSATNASAPIPEIVLQSPPSSLGLSADGEVLAIGSEDGTIALWERDGLRSLDLPSLAEGETARCLVFSTNGSTLFAGTNQGRVYLWNTANAKERARLPAVDGSPISAMAYGSDGITIVTGDEAGVLRVWDLDRSKRLVELRGHSAAITEVLLSSSKGEVQSRSSDGIAFTWGVSPLFSKAPPNIPTKNSPK